MHATVGVTDHLYWQGRAAWGRSSNKVSPFLTFTNKFDSERWLVSTSLTGRWQYGAWGFRPFASLANMHDTAQSNSDTFGLPIPSLRSTLGLAKAGPEFSYTFQPAMDWRVEPRLGAQVLWNSAGDTTVAGLRSIRRRDSRPLGRTWPDGIERQNHRPHPRRPRLERQLRRHRYRRPYRGGGTDSRARAVLIGLGRTGFRQWQGRATLVVPLQ